MPFLNNAVYDSGLSYITANATRLDVCSAEPTTFAQATSTLTLGNKTDYSVSAPGARTPDGRKVTTDAVSDGEITATGTATHWAITNVAGSVLIASGPLAAPQAVTSGNPMSVAAFDIGIPAPA